ncbi:acetoacetate--CoA ligase [Iodidimonas sp. SYSU 1G8]|uniref:acetoacetate--CoA ligase n=1 Tax=Iodidimonas sp. SYSU 1G8 TaxID=3133967 RepID=UPI0031FEF688
MESPETPLWTPSRERVADSNMVAFMRVAEETYGLALPDYDALWRWSVEQPEQFWSTIWDFCGVIAQDRGAVVLADADKMPGARFFPDARLSFAQNLLRRRDGAPALIFRGEDKVARELSWDELYDSVSRMAQAMRGMGLQEGDRVAAYMPNMPETVIAMLAANSIGAIFSSASPDFGVQGVVDRFGQIEPRLLILADGYYYGGKTVACLDKLGEILDRMPTIETAVVVPYVNKDGALPERAVTLEAFVEPYAPREIDFAQLPFNHPLYIMFSSGTTGVPKCIVHGQGGTLLQHLKEQQLNGDIRPGDRVFWFTTCGWMMWNWLVSALASEATLLLYDGSPFHPDGNTLFDYADAAGMTFFGTSAKFIDACNKAGIEPMRTHDLSSVRVLGSTGSPLVAESFDYVYRSIKTDIHLSSISGGTDLLSCFVLSSPLLPVWRGEIQCAGLGMAVAILDDDREPVPDGEKGELVCLKPFPSMPLGFWNDPGDAKYRAAYFDKFPGIWCHGDFIARTPHGGYVIYGRSDATLNAGGVRIGTAEIYRQVEQIDEVVESLVIGQDWDNDTRIVLFVRLREGVELTEALEKRIKVQIRSNTTPRHVPSRILQVTDIPRTKSGKIVELAVREVVHGRPVKNMEALANPEALEEFRARAELAL